VLRKIFGPQREEVAEGWRKLQNEEHDLYYSAITCRWMQWAELMACMRRIEMYTGI
jgi:hypothetical protein